MTESTTETGRPLDENPTQELPELPEHDFEEEEIVTDPELERLENLERHGQLTEAADQNRLAELREEDSNGEVDS